MKIEEFADIIGCNIILQRHANQSNRWTAAFERAETKNNKTDRILGGTYGSGKSPSEALFDYVSRIKGKWLVIGASSDDRREFGVPSTLEV